MKKFNELSPSEKVEFMDLLAYADEHLPGDKLFKIDVVKKFNLDLRDPTITALIKTESYTPAIATEETVATESEYRPLSQEKKKEPNPFVGTVDDNTDTGLAVINYNKISSVKDEQAQLTKYYGDNWIVMQNRLIHAISHLTLNERRLVLFLSPVIREETAKNPIQKQFTIRVQDYLNEYNIKSKKYYKELENSATSIQKKLIEFWSFSENDKLKEKTKIAWVTKGVYKEGKGEIVLEFHPDVLEMLTIFSKVNPYTRYQRQWVANLGAYGLILLELASSCLYQKHKKRFFSMNYLREKFDCVDKYEKTADFRSRILNKAIEEMHAHTPIRASYVLSKEGREVVGFVFSFENIDTKSGIEPEEKDKTPSKAIDLFSRFKMTEKQLALFSSKIAKATGEEITKVVDELSNIHLQSKHIERLKLLDFVPSAWYTDEECATHQTLEDITEQNQQARDELQNSLAEEKALLEEDFLKLKQHAETFVVANKRHLRTTGEKALFKNGNYQTIIQMWHDYLTDAKSRALFDKVDEILSLFID